MSFDDEKGELEIPFVLYVRWTVSTYGESESSMFRFQNNEWSLSYSHEPIKDDHFLCLVKKSRGRNTTDPFDVSVHVESRGVKRIVMEGLSKKECVQPHEDFNTVWWMSGEDIVRAYPEFKRGNIYDELRFLVEFKVKKECIIKDTDFRSLRAKCSILNAAGKDGSLRSTSVQTTMLSNTISCLESLSEDLTKLMAQGSEPDVEMSCSGQTIRAHKLIVCQRSPVIASMLGSDMVEGRTGVVKIPNMEPDIFTQFMRFIYSGQLQELTFETALQLYEAGDQYEVQSLAKKCSEFLLDHLTIDNACEVLTIADAHSNEEFVEKVVDYMVDKRVPLVSEDWPDFCDEHADLAFTVLHHGWKVFSK